MKKNTLILIFIGLMLPLFSATFAGIVDADIGVSGETDALALENTDRITLKGYIPFGSNIPMSLTAEGYYEFGFSKPLESGTKSTMSHLVNVSELQFLAQFPIGETNNLSLQAGRFFVYDTTALVLAQPMDGAKILFAGSRYEISTHVGFTGFLNGYDVTMFGVGNENILSEVYTFAPAFVLANVTFRLPYLFDAQHAFSAEFNGAFDVSGSTESSNRLYATLGLQGPIGTSFYYNVNTTLNYILLEENVLGNATILEISAFLPLNTILSWKTIFATGGVENNFIPITEIMATMDSSIEYAGTLSTGLLATISPINSLLMFASADALFNVMDSSREKGYSGIQANFSTRWNIQTDVQLTANVGSYISNEADTKPYLDASVGLAITF